MKRWWKRAYKPHSLQGAIHLVLVNTISVSLLGCALRMTQQAHSAKGVRASFPVLFYRVIFREEKQNTSCFGSWRDFSKRFSTCLWFTHCHKNLKHLHKRTSRLYEKQFQVISQLLRGDEITTQLKAYYYLLYSYKTLQFGPVWLYL